jgi:hypothetical protein
MTLRFVVLVPLLGACSTPAPAPQAGGLPPQPAEAAYRSAFDGYSTDREPDRIDWRKANEAVHTIGGWRSYAREAQAPSGAAK